MVVLAVRRRNNVFKAYMWENTYEDHKEGFYSACTLIVDNALFVALWM